MKLSGLQWSSIFGVIFGLILIVFAYNFLSINKNANPIINHPDNTISSESTPKPKLYQTPWHLLSYYQKAELSYSKGDLKMARKAIRYALLNITQSDTDSSSSKIVSLYKDILSLQGVHTNLVSDSLLVLNHGIRRS